MKKLHRPILTILLICIIFISTSTISFASDLSDPVGNCISVPRLEILR